MINFVENNSNCSFNIYRNSITFDAISFNVKSTNF